MRDCKSISMWQLKTYVKADLHSASFSRANNTFRWRMLSFRSSFEDNETWINCKAPIFCLLKIISFLIITKSVENLKLLWFETWHTSFSWFYFIRMEIRLYLFVFMKILYQFKNFSNSLFLLHLVFYKILYTEQFNNVSDRSEITLYIKLCRAEMFWKKGALRNFAKFNGKHLFQSLFFNKIAGMRPATLFKKRLLGQMLSCKFCKISKNTFL